MRLNPNQTLKNGVYEFKYHNKPMVALIKHNQAFCYESGFLGENLRKDITDQKHVWRLFTLPSVKDVYYRADSTKKTKKRVK